MGSQSSLLRPRRIRAAQQKATGAPTNTSATNTTNSKPLPLPLPRAGPFRPLPASAGILLGVEASSRIRYTTLAALLKATPATSLLAAQRQRLVTIHTATKSLRDAFLKLIDAEILSAPVYDDDAREWVGFLDVRDLIDLMLLRYLWRRESQGIAGAVAAVAQPTTGDSKATVAAVPVAKATITPTPQSTTNPTATPPAQSSGSSSGCNSSSNSKSSSSSGSGSDAKVGSIHAPDFVDDALAHTAEVEISLRSLAERYPWRPLPAATATLFDVAKELLIDARRVPIVETITNTTTGEEHQQLIGVITQSAIISFLSSKMTEISGRGHVIHAPFVINSAATALLDAEHSKTKLPTLWSLQKQAAATAVTPVSAKPGNSTVTSSADALVVTTSGLAQAAALKAQSTAEATAKQALSGLELAESGVSAWQVPLTELAMPNSTGNSQAPSPVLGSYPVWTIPAGTPLAEALWSMSEAATTSAVIADPNGLGGLAATLSVGDLKIFLRQMQKRLHSKSNAHGSTISCSTSSTSVSIDSHSGSDFTDSLLEGDVLEFVHAVRRADDFASLEAVRNAKTQATQQTAIQSPHAMATAPVLTVGTGASLAHVVHRLAVSRAHKCYVVGATAPFVPLRVISLTDILRYVVAADTAETAASESASALAATASAADK